MALGVPILKHFRVNMVESVHDKVDSCMISFVTESLYDSTICGKVES